MRRLIGFIALGLAATGFSVAPVQAAEPEMVTVCHVTGSANSADSSNSYTWHVGHEVTVPLRAYERAFANQGDVLASSFGSGYYITPDHQWWKFLADDDGSLTSGDCAYRY